MKKFTYKNVDGFHWSDADKGDDLYYSIDADCYLDTQGTTLTDVEWTVPEEILITDQYEEGTEVFVRLQTDVVGVFEVLCKLQTTKDGRLQTNVVPMLLTVL